ncbi:MAG: YihY/virulence factor BrkB family protein [Bacteroidota bacterium]|nr:YihY/virulence factor BrkB family protein [Bacteroidota bacterium]
MQHKNVKRLIKFQFIHRIIKASKKIILPGFEGISLYVVSKFFFHGIGNGNLNTRSQSLAFSFFLALFPSIIFLFTLIPYIPIEHFQDSLFNLLQTLLPKSAFEATEETIADIIKNQRGGLLSVGFISALYFSTNGFNEMMNAFNETFHVIETRSVLKQRLISLVMVIMTTVFISIAIALIIFSEIVLQKIIEKDNLAYYLILFGKWFILITLCFSFISFNYYLGPKRKKGFNFFSPGSILATILTIITSLLFAYYVNNFGNYNKLYGSIGTLIVIMLFIYINSLILLLGFDLNASILSAKRKLGRLHHPLKLERR